MIRILRKETRACLSNPNDYIGKTCGMILDSLGPSDAAVCLIAERRLRRPVLEGAGK
jgi:hypothetical protein